MTTTPEQSDPVILAEGVDEEPVERNRRLFTGVSLAFIATYATLYAGFHMAALNGVSISAWTGIDLPFLPQFPMETWNFRIVHVSGALALGFLLYSARLFPDVEKPQTPRLSLVGYALMIPALVSAYMAIRFAVLVNSGTLPEMGGLTTWPAFPGTEIYDQEFNWFGIPLLIATFGAIVLGWFENTPRHRFSSADIVLAICGVVVALYLVPIYSTAARNSVGTPFVPIGVAFAATAGTALILELTRRVAGLALIIITGVFLVYTFTAHLLPGILANFAFAAAGRARGGPAKVAIFASGLMGMINGTSAGNVVATGSLTIPLMKKVGYHKRTAGAIEAAASTGGQIMPPIMGAGAFIMAEITGIPYTEIAIAAIIPAILYFTSIYFMVDLEAAKLGMRGMREDELPKLKILIRQVYLFIPIIILIAALFMGYSVIRAGTLATVAAAVVSWLTPHRMGIFAILKAFEMAGIMAIQIIAVVACAGIIVGVISLTGVGARFSSVLLGLADASQLIALIFAMMISILLGMGMPTTAAYAVAASVVAPGLVQLGIPPLTAHFFVFYFAVVSAITPPVALASYAAAGISGANPMETSVASFKIGIAAFIVPFMFFYNSAILMDGTVLEIMRAAVTAVFGVFLLSSGVQGWFVGGRSAWFIRAALVLAALFMIEGGFVSDLIGIATAVGVYFVQKVFRPAPDTTFPVRGAD